MNTKRLTAGWWALRVGLGGAAFLAGLDKYFNLVADGTSYLSPVATAILPVGGDPSQSRQYAAARATA
jgi:hypothetical protein